MNKQLPVAVLGAGIAGLVAARELRRRGVPVRVMEAGKQVAGMAATTKDADGFSYDLGGHFITNRLAAALGVGAGCRVVRRYGEVVHLEGAYHRYPMGLLGVPRFVSSALGQRVRAKKPARTAREWFEQEYGPALAQEVALPLLEAWSGARAEDLAPSVGDKIPSSLGETLFLRAASRLTGRAVAIGYCKTAPQSANVFHVYPAGGVGAICHKLAQDLGDSIELESPVSKIYVEKGRARAIRLGTKDVPVRAVVSTAPINKLPELISGSDAFERFKRFRFRPIVFVNLKLEGERLLPEVMTWVPKDKPFFRITEAPQSMPWLAPPKKTMVLAEYGATVGDGHWTMSDDELTKYTVRHLASFIPDIDRRLLGARVQRSPIAYPIFLREYEEERASLERGTGVENLLSIGRNGEFDHILMEDIYWRTLRRIRTFVERDSAA